MNFLPAPCRSERFLQSCTATSAVGRNVTDACVVTTVTPHRLVDSGQTNLIRCLASSGTENLIWATNLIYLLPHVSISGCQWSSSDRSLCIDVCPLFHLHHVALEYHFISSFYWFSFRTDVKGSFVCSPNLASTLWRRSRVTSMSAEIERRIYLPDGYRQQRCWLGIWGHIDFLFEWAAVQTYGPDTVLIVIMVEVHIVGM